MLFLVKIHLAARDGSPLFAFKIEEFQAGDRVLVALPYSTENGVCFGAMAETLIAPATNVVKIPDNLDFATAAKVSVAYGTAHIALKRCGRLKKDETLLVNGGTGSVGKASGGNWQAVGC